MTSVAASYRRVFVLAGLIGSIVLLTLLMPSLRPTMARPTAQVAAAGTRKTELLILTATAVSTKVDAVFAPTMTSISPTSEPEPAAVLPTETAKPTKTAEPSAMPANATVVALPLSENTPPLRVAVIGARYSLAGTPTDGCGKFNAQHVIRRFDVELAITNQTDQDITSEAWGAAAYAGPKTALLCYFEGQGTLPPLVANHTASVTLTAFVEIGQEVDTLLIGTASGKIAKLCFSNGKQHVC